MSKVSLRNLVASYLRNRRHHAEREYQPDHTALIDQIARTLARQWPDRPNAEHREATAVFVGKHSAAMRPQTSIEYILGWVREGKQRWGRPDLST